MDLDKALMWAANRRTATLITLRRDGRPQSSDIAFAVFGGEIRISVTADRAKTRNISRDPRVVLHLSDPGAWSYVAFGGDAELSSVTQQTDDATADDLVELYRAVAGEDHPDWDEFRSAMVDEKRLVIRLSPSSATGQIN